MLLTKPPERPSNLSLYNSLRAKIASDLVADEALAGGGEYEPTYPTYPQQSIFVQELAHYAAFIAGIGSGKTIAGSVRAWRAAYGYIGHEKILQTPNLGIVTAPTYPMLRDATLRAFLDVTGSTVIRHNKSEGIVELANGSEILFRSTEYPERLRGPSISWWWGDEAALYEARVWDIMIGRLRQFGKRGYAWITSTPKGRNWLYKTFVQDNQDKPDYFVQKASSRDNPFLDRSIVQSWEQAYVGDFARQELEAEFIAFEGLIYPEFSRELHVSHAKPTAFSRIIAGVDWGLVNPGVLLVIGLDSDQRAYLIHEEYQRQRQIHDWANVAKQLRDTWNISEFYCDPSEPEHIKIFNSKPGVRASGADNSVIPGIQAVKSRLVRQADLKPRLFISPNAVNTLAEFESYQWSENRHGMKDEPLKSGDHAMDALRYALYALEVRKPFDVSVQRYA